MELGHEKKLSFVPDLRFDVIILLEVLILENIVLQNHDGRIFVTSLDVAEKFNKNHNHVMRDIDKLISDCPKMRGSMFLESTYKNTRGKTYRCYLIDRDGFSILTMGFTGKKALEWKLKYIVAFNQMEERLKSGDTCSDEEKLKLQLFSKDPEEVAEAQLKLRKLIAEDKYN